MAFPGHILKSKRESLGFSLQDITDHLSIPSDIITALESGQPMRNPESSFAVGFLRSYCSFLGLEAEMMIAELQKATKSRKSARINRDRTLFQFQFPKLKIPNISIDLPTELVGWISITALLILGWFAYSTFAPTSNSNSENTTDATTIELQVPQFERGRVAP